MPWNSQSLKLPYPLTELENTPRHNFRDKEFRHYVFFWGCVGALGGVGCGFIAFGRRHRYRMWVRKQPQSVQLKILEKNNILSNPGLGQPQIASSRFSTAPNAMDTRIELPYSRYYRPYLWYELGPLKLWNNLAYYPWASEAFLEVGKWSVRLSLLSAVTLSFESAFCFCFGYPLGSNIAIRAMSGTMTGYLMAKIASEGCLIWYHQIGIALLLGGLWGFTTWYYPNWGELARENRFVLELYSSGIHKAVRKHDDGKSKLKQLYAKDMKEKHALYEELVDAKLKEYYHVDDIDLAATMTPLDGAKKKAKFYEKWLFGDIDAEIPKEIDEMPYELRKIMEQDAIAASLALNYKVWPFTQMRKWAPQWFTLETDTVTENDTEKIIQSTMHNQKDSFSMDHENALFNTGDQDDDLSMNS